MPPRVLADGCHGGVGPTFFHACYDRVSMFSLTYFPNETASLTPRKTECDILFFGASFGVYLGVGMFLRDALPIFL